jgi:hypothetical protein
VQMPVPWATGKGGFTALFERIVIALLSEMSISAVARNLHLSWLPTFFGIQRQRAASLAFTNGLMPKRRHFRATISRVCPTRWCAISSLRSHQGSRSCATHGWDGSASSRCVLTPGVRLLSVEYFSVEPRGFLWDARIRMTAMMPIYIRDGYFGGEGAMYGQLAAIVPVVNQRGTSKMASGELLRYLAELVLLPTALLPRCGIESNEPHRRGAFGKPATDTYVRTCLHRGMKRVW